MTDYTKYTPMTVFVYIGVNPLFPGIVKVGSSVSPQERLTRLSIAIPEEYELARDFALPTQKAAIKVERMAHQMLQTYRVRNELFRCSVEEATAAVNKSTLRYFGYRESRG